MNGNLELEVGSKGLTAHITLSFVKFHVVIWQVFLQNFVNILFLIKKFVKWQHLFYQCKSIITNKGKISKPSWMNERAGGKIGFFSKHGVGSWVKSFDSEHYLKERDRYILRLTLPSSSVGISIFFSDHYLWIMILFTARYIFFQGTFFLFH